MNNKLWTIFESVANAASVSGVRPEVVTILVIIPRPAMKIDLKADFTEIKTETGRIITQN